MSTEGLRERNKARKRQAILKAAYELFIERGYDTATLTDIAARAEVSRRTLTLYFPTKLSLALAHLDSIDERLFAALGRRRADQTSIDVLEEWLAGEADRHQDGLQSLTETMLAVNPQLQTAQQTRIAETIERGARHLAEENGVAPDSLDARMTAAAAAAVVGCLGPGPTREGIAAAMAFLRAGMAALAARPTDG
ncbi:helix-turn-helix domain-containing protein [Streptomyces sp. CRN 30]|uniref:TetR/AcrR family transcriptional regulator n=1 Tax=Streptomyces sp. CRN 30 TaxID=3075613 RepID=UPI002A83F260|nr:helix-turn-helix domain-containing protein [Streptomyces sp. CRN 30]